MPNISDWPSGAAVCSLSQVLVRGSIPEQYFLSSKACAGILRRAEKRGKQLPTQLRLALQAAVEGSNAPETREDKIPSSPSTTDEFPKWECRDCEEVWRDKYATSPESVDSLSPPECPKCGNEAANVWIGPDEFDDLLAA